MANADEVKRADCGCCGMWEECTVEYIGHVQERFGGIWVCGLCEEAIKDEQARLGVSVEVAVRLHATFRDNKNGTPTVHVVHSIIQLLRKLIFSNPSSPAFYTSPPS